MSDRIVQTISYENIPTNRFHLRVAIAGTGGQFSDGVVLGITGIVLASATAALDLSALEVGLLGAASLIGLFIGALFTGPIADRIGRQAIFRWDMLVFAMLSASQFLVQEAWQLLALRLLLGLTLGADYVVSKSLVTEHSPRKMRGRLLSLMAVSWATGYAMSYLVGFLLSDTGSDAWRIMLLVSSVPAVLVLLFRITIPESPLWLVEHGQASRAAEVVRRHAGAHVIPPTAVTASTLGKNKMALLMSRKYRRRTAIGAIFYVCQVVPYFALGTFSPQVMKALGVDSELGGGAIYNVFLLVGALIGMTLVDKIPRRTFLIGSFMAGAAALACLIIFSALSPILAVLLFACFALILSAAANLEFVYPPELFETDMRASGVGVATAASRFGSAGSTFLLPLIVAGFGINVALSACVVVLLAGGIASWAWAPETRNESLTSPTGAMEGSERSRHRSS